MICYYCRKEFDPSVAPGAVMVSPPGRGSAGEAASSVFKYHVCGVCWVWLGSVKPPPPECDHAVVQWLATDNGGDVAGMCLDCNTRVLRYYKSGEWIQD